MLEAVEFPLLAKRPLLHKFPRSFGNLQFGFLISDDLSLSSSTKSSSVAPFLLLSAILLDDWMAEIMPTKRKANGKMSRINWPISIIINFYYGNGMLNNWKKTIKRTISIFFDWKDKGGEKESGIWIWIGISAAKLARIWSIWGEVRLTLTD
jgi:hypothetical protein